MTVKHNAPRWKQVDTDTLGASEIVTCNIISKYIHNHVVQEDTRVYAIHNSNSLSTFRFSFITSETHRYDPWHAFQARSWHLVMPRRTSLIIGHDVLTKNRIKFFLIDGILRTFRILFK